MHLSVVAEAFDYTDIIEGQIIVASENIDDVGKKELAENKIKSKEQRSIVIDKSCKFLSQVCANTSL